MHSSRRLAVAPVGVSRETSLDTARKEFACATLGCYPFGGRSRFPGSSAIGKPAAPPRAASAAPSCRGTPGSRPPAPGCGIVVQQREQMSTSPPRPAACSRRIRCIASGVPDLRQRLLAEVAQRRAVQHVALAAGIHVAVLLDVHRPAPEVVAGVLPVLRGVAGLGPHQVGLVFLDAHLVDARHGAPEAQEIVHLAGVALHLHHLHHHLQLEPRSCFMRAKRTKLSRTFSKFAPLR